MLTSTRGGELQAVYGRLYLVATAALRPPAMFSAAADIEVTPHVTLAVCAHCGFHTGVLLGCYEPVWF